MIHFSRLGTFALIAGGLLPAYLLTAAEVELRPAIGSGLLLLANSAQGYLGVGLNDVDNDRASALKLKDPHGAEILTVDQDAPAAKAGLRIHDVIVQMNGQRIESVEQLRRLLRETPPGRTVSLVAVRDGQSVNLNVQLADRAMIAKSIIGGLDDQSLPSLPPADVAGAPQVLLLPRSHGSGFLESFGRNRYYVGVELQPLPTGLAEYFGVHNGSGVLVANVFSNSPASAAGLKAADVIQKVNGQPIVTLSDWERAIRANRGKQVPVIVIRDKKEQTLTMAMGGAKTSGELDEPELVLPSEQMIAELQNSLTGIDAATIAAQAQDETKTINVEALRKEAEEAANSIDIQQIQKAVDQGLRQVEENRQQIEQQMQELRQALPSLRIQQMD